MGSSWPRDALVRLGKRVRDLKDRGIGGLMVIQGIDLYANDDGEFRIHLVAENTDAHGYAYVEGLDPEEPVWLFIEAGKLSSEHATKVEWRTLDQQEEQADG